MKVVLQRVSRAAVSVDGEVIGAIGKGFLLLLGVSDTDTEQTADRMVDKICKLRIFEDENGKTNLSLADVGGALLVVSQFTLYADCKKGNRSSFVSGKLVEAAHEKGKAIHAWTVNNKSEMERMKMLGVDNIITDYPVLAREIVYRERATETLFEYLRLVLK